MRSQYLNNVKRIVIKIGSRVITCEDLGLDFDAIRRIAAEVAEVRKMGYEVLLVSSGAVAAGRKDLGLLEKPRSIPHKQAAAAVGQSSLIQAYRDAFSSHQFTVAQVLLTSDDLADRQRFLNSRATLDTLLDFGVVPIINENDTVAVEEIKFGDNDNLSALVTTLAEANLLVILTDIEGFYDSDPRINSSARLVPLVKHITKEVERAAGGSGSGVGTGGMSTKVAAARKVGKSGVPALVVNGRTPGIILNAVAGEEVGTLFLPAREVINRRKHWIAYTLRPKGRIVVDDGAVAVLQQQGRSLLPSGIILAEGDFERGSCVRICRSDGKEFARGLSDYSLFEISRIQGRRSGEIEEILGYKYGDEIVHRDNLVIL